MREFFRQELKSLELKTGYKQYERLLEREKWEEDLNQLLDAMCRVCDLFPYIPEEDKKAFIQEAVLTDQDFTGYNARTIYKWLNAKRARYFVEEAHKGMDVQAEPVTGPEREEWLKKWNESLGVLVEQVNPERDPDTKAQTLRDWVREKPAEPIERTYVDEEAKTKHIQYIRENYELNNGRKLPTWIPENEWLKKLNSPTPDGEAV